MFPFPAAHRSAFQPLWSVEFTSTFLSSRICFTTASEPLRVASNRALSPSGVRTSFNPP
ncbi:uncharacterized protein BJX67DRAFT_368745 [Aspergillus lucknowensis]|uniref:Uncharacterized protein n=1 Tax=Aspergillus lucknowensis TaxID=176173 RepID=A0ABR4L5K0_9EURO